MMMVVMMLQRSAQRRSEANVNSAKKKKIKSVQEENADW